MIAHEGYGSGCVQHCVEFRHCGCLAREVGNSVVGALVKTFFELTDGEGRC